MMQQFVQQCFSTIHLYQQHLFQLINFVCKIFLLVENCFRHIVHFLKPNIHKSHWNFVVLLLQNFFFFLLLLKNDVTEYVKLPGMWHETNISNCYIKCITLYTWINRPYWDKSGYIWILDTALVDNSIVYIPVSINKQ